MILKGLRATAPPTARMAAGGFASILRRHQLERYNPPVLGDNEIRIEIKDPQGGPVLDAEVLVNYYMPPMPKMAPMNYTIPAPLKGKEYRAVMDLIMTGPWNIVARWPISMSALHGLRLLMHSIQFSMCGRVSAPPWA